MKRPLPSATACAGLALALLLAAAPPAWANSLPSISDQTFTTGTAVSLTLPEVTWTSNTCITNQNLTEYSILETLPQGLSFTASTRVLSGTPTTAAAQATFTYRAYCPGAYITVTKSSRSPCKPRRTSPCPSRRWR